MKTMLSIFLILSAAQLAVPVAAHEQIGVDAQVPAALRNRPATSPPAAGAALQAQVLSKLEAQFHAADLDGNGTLSP